MDRQLVFRFGAADQTLETFFPGPNELVQAELEAVATGAGDYWLVLRGPVGSGKTHLLTATCRVASDAGHRAGYLPLGDRKDFEVRVLDGMEELDLICLDDLDTIAGDETWERGVFDLLNRLKQGGRRFVGASESALKDAGFGLPDLVSRLNWGATYPLKPLSDEEKLRALQLRARARGFEMTEPVAKYLIERLSRDMVSLFGVFDRLDHVALQQQRRLTVPFVRQALQIGQKCTSS
jgi:DnaA family protein